MIKKPKRLHKLQATARRLYARATRLPNKLVMPLLNRSETTPNRGSRRPTKNSLKPPGTLRQGVILHHGGGGLLQPS